MILDVHIITGTETGNAARAPTTSVQVMNLIHIVQMRTDVESVHILGSEHLKRLVSVI